MLPASLWLLCITVLEARAATTTDSNDFYSTSIHTLKSFSIPSLRGSKYTYATLNGQKTVESSSSGSALPFTTRKSTGKSTTSTIKPTITIIGGDRNTTTSSSHSTRNSTRTSSSTQPKNTVPCNGFPEFCDRSYSNITQVCAHNSAFSVQGNAASNQQLPIYDQLQDGIRMLQGETHWINNTVQNCHTSCNLLDAGTWQSSLEILTAWVEANPYNVVTWLIVNSDFRPVTDYVSAIEKSGLRPYLYEPAYIPQKLDQWPSLGEMILNSKRVVMFMDYNANQSAVPYILDEFTHMFETPFSPTDRSFPCTLQRPPGLEEKKAKKDFMYLANHNLNTGVNLKALLGDSSGGNADVVLIPNTAEINVTNGQYDKFGQLGEMSQSCTGDWGRPPNFLLVDYYNYGKAKPGSVFEVAAKANGVKYHGKCCGNVSGAANIHLGWVAFGAAFAFATLWVW